MFYIERFVTNKQSGGKDTNKQQAKIVGVVLSVIGIILLIFAIISYVRLQQRVGWYLDMFPSSTRYNQEMMSYAVMGIIGVILLITGIVFEGTSSQKKPITIKNQPVVNQQPVKPASSSQQVVFEQPVNKDTKMKETSGEGFMYNRADLIFGIVFIAIGIIVFITAIWSEPVVNPVEFPQWFFLVFRIIALICVVAGIVGIIAALIPKKQ